MHETNVIKEKAAGLAEDIRMAMAELGFTDEAVARVEDDLIGDETEHARLVREALHYRYADTGGPTFAALARGCLAHNGESSYTDPEQFGTYVGALDRVLVAEYSRELSELCDADGLFDSCHLPAICAALDAQPWLHVITVVERVEVLAGSPRQTRRSRTRMSSNRVTHTNVIGYVIGDGVAAPYVTLTERELV